jgi:hypothetical protein
MTTIFDIEKSKFAENVKVGDIINLGGFGEPDRKVLEVEVRKDDVLIKVEFWKQTMPFDKKDTLIWVGAAS